VRACCPSSAPRSCPSNKVFGESYPYGNKIECLAALPGEALRLLRQRHADPRRSGRGAFRFRPPLGLAAGWKAPGRRSSSTDPATPRSGNRSTTGSASISKARSTSSQPDEYWRRYLYFNAGFFYYRCPHVFGARFLEIARGIRDDPPPELVCQSLDPWLDQVALPLVIHDLGGGRDALAAGMAGRVAFCHYRLLPLLYAREADRVVESWNGHGPQPDQEGAEGAMTR
jgi:hypothetical protein